MTPTVVSKGVNNPFAGDIVGETWAPPLGSLPDLHRGVLDRLADTVRTVRANGVAMGLLVRGEAGSGKTHLIAQYRKETLSNDPNAFVVSIPMQTYASGIWRWVRKRLVEDLLKKRWNPEAAELNGLGIVLRNRFGNLAADKKASWSIFDIITGGKSGPTLADRLADFADDQDIAHPLRIVLPRLWDPKLCRLAADWLRGSLLAEDELRQLDLPAASYSDQDQEQVSREIVLGMCRLAGEKTTLVICFDQLDGMQAGTRDDAAYRAFANLATQLIMEPGPRLVVTFVRPDMIVPFRRAVEHSDVQRMAQVEAEIPPVERLEDAVRLALARLDADPSCRAERAKHGDDWPFGTAFFQKLYDDNRLALTPRILIRSCRAEFIRLQTGAVPLKVDPFGDMWKFLRKGFIEKPQSVSFDNVLTKGLPWLAELVGAPVERVQTADSSLENVNLLFQPAGLGRKLHGISLCNQEPKVLWHRLRSLHKLWTNPGRRLGTLVVVRGVTPPPTPKGQEWLDALAKAGVSVVLLDHQQLADIAALQRMLEGAHNGDLAQNGKPVGVETLSSWAKATLSGVARGVFDSLFDPALRPAVTSAPGQASPAQQPQQPFTPVVVVDATPKASSAKVKTKK